METAQLAPASGIGIGKLVADALLGDGDFVEVMRQTARDCLNATTERYDREEKKVLTVPDYRTRAQMFFGLLAQMEGEPIKRIVHQHIGGNIVDPIAALNDSPALRAAVERALEKSRFRTRHATPGESLVAGETLDLA